MKFNWIWLIAGVIFAQDTEGEGLICQLCIGTLELFKSILDSSFAEGIWFRYQKSQCMKEHTENYCVLNQKNWLVPLYHAHFRRYNSHELCTKSYFCSKYKYVEETNKMYDSRVLRDTPPLWKFASKSTPLKKIKFALITDLHSDEDYEEGRSTDCTDFICCRKSSPKATDPNKSAGLFGSYTAKCDVPLITLESMIDYLTKNLDPSFIIYLGDNPAHNMWEQTPAKHLDGMRNISRLIKTRFKGPVYSVLGNHGGYPVDNFDIHMKVNHSWILKGSANEWRQWLTEESYQTYLRIGCYSQLHPNSHLRIISM